MLIKGDVAPAVFKFKRAVLIGSKIGVYAPIPKSFRVSYILYNFSVLNPISYSMRIVICMLLLAGGLSAHAQVPDKVYAPGIREREAELRESRPLIPWSDLNSSDQLELN